jgi:hypothetical protein
MAIGNDDPVILDAILKDRPNILFDGKENELDHLYFVLSYGATRNLEFLLKRALLSHNENLLLKYLVFLNFLEEFSVSSLLIPYKEEMNRIIYQWMGGSNDFLLNFVIPWGSLKAVEYFVKAKKHFHTQQKALSIHPAQNLLTKAIECKRDLAFIRGIAERYPVYIFNKSTGYGAVYPMDAAIRLGRLDVVQDLKCVENKYPKVKHGDMWEFSFQYEYITIFAATSGHAHFFPYLKENSPQFQKHLETVITDLRNFGAGQYRMLQYFDDIKQWKNSENQNLLHLASENKGRLDVETVDWLMRKNPDFWSDRDNDNRTPLDLAFLNKSKEIIFYALALNKIPLGPHLVLTEDIHKIRNEFNEGLRNFFSLYFAICYFPRYEIGLDLTEHIVGYLAKESIEKAMCIGIEKVDSRDKLFQQAIPLIYTETHQTRTELKASPIAEWWLTIPQQKERHAAAQTEVNRMVQLATKGLTPSEQKQLEEHIREKKAALTTTYFKSELWPSKDKSRRRAKRMAWEWRQRLKDSTVSSSPLTIGPA